jgi:hypothetical protein
MPQFKLITLLSILIGTSLFPGTNSLALETNKENWFLRNIQVPKDLTPGNTKEQIVIAVVDDGFRTSHRDLAGFIWQNPKEVPDNNIDDDGNGYVDDINGWDAADHNNSVTPPPDRLADFYHGTHLAGIIAQIAQTAYGDDAAEFVRIMPVKGLADRAEKTYIKAGFKGIQYAIAAGADIVLCAWGVAFISPEETKVLNLAEEKGILIMASAGNFPEGKEQYPAAHNSVLAVAAVDREDRKISKSNFGSFVDLSAPGIDIQSSSVLSDTGYEGREGTSFATAMAAAAAAIVKLQHPSYSTTQIKACLKNSAKAIDSVNPDYSAKLGAGRLDITEAIAARIFTTATGEKNSLVSPQGYLNYNSPRSGPGQTTWDIRPSGRFKGLWFKPASVPAKESKGTFNFYTFTTKEPKLVATHTLADLPAKIFIPGTVARVMFEPDVIKEDSDWLLEYRAESIDFSKLFCSGTENLSSEGTIDDGSKAESYSNNTDCKWLITAPEGKVIHIEFTEFDTEAKRDKIYFFNGTGTHEKIMAIFSGPDIPPELTTWSNRVLVWFVTDGMTQGKGWKARYSFR